MENIGLSEQTAVLDVNGIAVDVSVIEKDAEIELNNNEMVKSDKSGDIEPTIDSANEKNDDEKVTESSESSLNTDNGREKNVDDQQQPEGESKVDETPETADVIIEKSESSEPSASTDSTTSNTSDETESSENIEQNSTEKVVDPSQPTNDDDDDDDDDDEKQAETNTVTPTENENVASNNTESTANTSSNVDDEAKTDSPAKSPRKKSANKKRKNRSRSRKSSTTDYSKFDNYVLSVSQRQRRYFLEIPRGRLNVPVPGDDCEVFVSNIPINVLEPELLPLFERFGKIFELRLMMSVRNPKRNAGFAFVRYTGNDAAAQATEKLNNYEIVPGKHLSIRLSQPNLSLFVGNIHRGLTREQIHEKLGNKTTGLVKTFVKNSLYEDTKNCGFCFLEYDSHSSALKAKRLLNRGNVWGRQLFVDWAQRRKQIDDATLEESKTIFINYLPKEITDQQINDALSTFGQIEKITKIKDYAFVLFAEHQAAMNALNDVDKSKFGTDAIEVALAMPKTTKTRTRAPASFAYRRSRYSRRRNDSYNRYMPRFSSTTKLNIHKSSVGKMENRPNMAQQANTSQPVDEQTIIPTVFVTQPEPVAVPVQAI